jgi:hypothetical protein
MPSSIEPARPTGEHYVRFRLTYEGILKGAGSTKMRADHKHDIRRAFHPQLQELWRTLPVLGRPDYSPVPEQEFFINGLSISLPRSSRLEQLKDRFIVNDYHFVPLVTEDLSVLCEIHVLFLRPGLPGTLLESGDIDNRLKTLFDALRVPAQNELSESAKTPEDEKPFYCLLEDDKLVSHISVETDSLLEPVSTSPDKNGARIVITVRIRPYVVTIANLGFA